MLLRLYSTRGLYWTAILGGLVNSRAAVAELMAVGTGSRTTAVVLAGHARLRDHTAVALGPELPGSPAMLVTTSG